MTRAEAFTWGALGALIALTIAALPVMLVWG